MSSQPCPYCGSNAPTEATITLPEETLRYMRSIREDGETIEACALRVLKLGMLADVLTRHPSLMGPKQ